MGIILSLFLCLVFSCSNVLAETGIGGENEVEIRAAYDANGGTHRWFCFSPSGVSPVDLPQNASIAQTAPWTESIRISSAAQTENSAYFLVNRLGLIQLSDSPVKRNLLFNDALYFSDVTADSLVLIDKTPVFKVYRNAFFNEAKSDKSSPFLLQFRGDTKTFYPLLTDSDLGLNANCQAVDLFFDGKTWTGAFKNSSSDRVLFNYVQFSTQNSLINLTDLTKIGQIQKNIISSELYKDLTSPKPIENADEKLQNLLQIPISSIPILVKSSCCDGNSPKIWTNDFSTNDYFSARAFLGQNFSIAVFEDGTAYFSGKFGDETPVVKSFKLPLLPENFKYGDIAVCGKMLYVAWDETFFYETRRSGFLAVDLETALK